MKFALKWLLAFLLLISLNVFMEAYVFEWLNWNGTTKNDWFFMLWWILVFAWGGLWYAPYSKKITLAAKIILLNTVPFSFDLVYSCELSLFWVSFFAPLLSLVKALNCCVNNTVNRPMIMNTTANGILMC